MTVIDKTRRYVDERAETALQLTRSGWFASEIAAYLGVTRRTVERYRARRRTEVRS
jgi:hypothetical protein